MAVRPLLLVAFCIIWLAAAPADARTTVIDDSATLPYNAALTLRWQQLEPRGHANNLMVGTLQLRVRLNVAPWVKRAVRIYLVLPAQQPAGVTASWTTHGRLLPGHLTAGSRTLVYSGLITTPFIEDVVQLTLTVDGRRMAQQPYPVNFRFEMDED
jgi:hypothetical protein